ncbi:hypothetical protein [Actinoplanes sp. URMC 104]|uniref:hypothetical protein n=1 Tax=Actinoplanes sp. URMC 104 TaxID=3423409 RepID=UPI003F19384C
MADLLPSDAAPTRLTAPVLITLGAAGMLLFAAAGGPATGSSDRLEQISLAAGDSSRALFEARQLVPGHTVSNCLSITGGGRNGREVRLSATDLTGTLVSGLNLRVEVGVGGCAVFTGRTVFDGPLTALAAAGATGVTTGWAPVARETRTYRLTVRVADDNRFQHATAGATFSWLDVAREEPKSARQPSPGTPVTSAPADDERRPAGRTPPESPDSTHSSGPGLLSALAQTAWKLLVATAGHPWYLAISLIAMWLFLFIADRREERDPKLSLAPVLRDPYLTFPRNEDHRAETD